eukprot:jgi/Botrbrau1/14118/Bobra.182_3s0061.1
MTVAASLEEPLGPPRLETLAVGGLVSPDPPRDLRQDPGEVPSVPRDPEGGQGGRPAVACSRRSRGVACPGSPPPSAGAAASANVGLRT